MTLANSLRLLRRHEEGEAILAAALQTAEQSFGPDSETTLEVVGEYGQLLRSKGDLAKAQPLLQRCLEGERKRHGNDSLPTAIAASNLAAVYFNQKDYDAAERLYRDSLRIRERLLDPDDAATQTQRLALGEIAQLRGQFIVAEQLFRTALAGYQKQLQADHVLIAFAKSLLGGCLTEQDKFDEAEPLLLAGYQGIVASPSSRPQRITEALDRVIRLYQKKKDLAKVAEWQSKRPQ